MSSQFGRQLWHGDIVLLGDAGQQKRPLRIELSVSPPATGLRLKASGHTIGLHQPQQATSTGFY
ncbi:MAG: hypothetical protein ACRED2_12580, partial [Methylocella sp.]